MGNNNVKTSIFRSFLGVLLTLKKSERWKFSHYFLGVLLTFVNNGGGVFYIN